MAKSFKKCVDVIVAQGGTIQLEYKAHSIVTVAVTVNGHTESGTCHASARRVNTLTEELTDEALKPVRKSFRPFTDDLQDSN